MFSPFKFFPKGGKLRIFFRIMYGHHSHVLLGLWGKGVSNTHGKCVQSLFTFFSKTFEYLDTQRRSGKRKGYLNSSY